MLLSRDLRQRMAERALQAYRFAFVVHVLAVMATEASRKVLVADVVRKSLPCQVLGRERGQEQDALHFGGELLLGSFVFGCCSPFGAAAAIIGELRRALRFGTEIALAFWMMASERALIDGRLRSMRPSSRASSTRLRDC